MKSKNYMANSLTTSSERISSSKKTSSHRAAKAAPSLKKAMTDFDKRNPRLADYLRRMDTKLATVKFPK